MSGERIAITGVGVVAPNGIGRDAFWEACAKEASGIKPITLFDTSSYRCKLAGEIRDFDPKAALGPKGLRNLDRTTLLCLVGAQEALRDARLDWTAPEVGDGVGVVLGSTMGSVHSISEFDKQGLREGPRSVNPAHFPNTVINAPASQVSIRFGLRAFNATISTGFTASLDALSYAADMLSFGRAKQVLVGGAEELCIQTYLGFYKLGMLNRQGREDAGGRPIPLDGRGTFLGEGAVFFVIERLEDARAREARVYGEIAGYGTRFDSASLLKEDRDAKATTAAIEQALEEAGITAEDVQYISTAENALRAIDRMEQTALNKGFGNVTSDPLVVSVKTLVGESFSAGGAFQLAALLGVLVRRAALVPAGAGGDSGAFPGASRGRCGLVTRSGLTGSSAALVVKEAAADA